MEMFYVEDLKIDNVEEDYELLMREYDNLRRNEHVKDLWREFGDIPMNPDTECIEVEWNGFPTGTHREEIWSWFEETYNISVAKDLMHL